MSKRTVKKPTPKTMPPCEYHYLMGLMRKKHKKAHECVKLEIKDLHYKWDVFVYFTETPRLPSGKYGINEYMLDYFSLKKKEFSRQYALAQLGD